MIALAGICAALGFSCMAELNRARSVVDNNLTYWAPEFADIYTHKDWLRLSKLGRTFAPPPVQTLVFREGDRTVFSFPSEVDELGCRLPEHHAVQQYGVTFGTLDICISPLSVLSLALASPLFLIISISLFFIIGFAAVFPVFSLRRGLSALVDHLSDWSKSTNSTGASAQLAVSKSDSMSVEGKLRSLAQGFVQQRLEAERKGLRDEIIRDVAHNVGSPVATLAIRVHKLEGISSEARTSITDGLDQISGILTKLKDATQLPSSKPSTQVRIETKAPVKVEMISALLDSIATDKRVEKSGKTDIQLRYDFTPEGYGAFAAVNAADFRVILSNLLNNAYEAMSSKGEIILKLHVVEERVRIIIQDTGGGIPAAILSELFSEGFTHGKEGGTGRGLFHSKKTMTTWNGSISIESPPGEGATVTLELPKAPPPGWFLPVLDLSDIDQVVVLDDDPTIAAVWKMLLPRRKITSFTHPETFKCWLAENKKVFSEQGRSFFFLVDHRLGESLPTGLDVIETEGLSDNAVLVTSDATLESVRKRCSFLGTKILWKSEISCIPLISGNDTGPEFRPKFAGKGDEK